MVDINTLRCVTDKKKVICFGAGNYLNVTKTLFDAEGIAIDILVDNDSQKWGVTGLG